MKTYTLSLFHQAGSRIHAIKDRSDQPQQSRIACVMRYHPVLVRAFKYALKVCPMPPTFGFKVIASWRNAYPSVSRCLDLHGERANIGGMGSGVHNGREVEGSPLLSNISFSHLSRNQHSVLLINDKLCNFKSRVSACNFNALAQL